MGKPKDYITYMQTTHGAILGFVFRFRTGNMGCKVLNATLKEFS